MTIGRTMKLTHVGSVVGGKSFHERRTPKRNGKPAWDAVGLSMKVVKGRKRASVKALTNLQKTAEGYVDSVGLLDVKLDALNAERARYADALRDALAGLLERGAEAAAEGSHYWAQLFETIVTTVDPARLKSLVRTGYYKLVRVDLKAARFAVGDLAITRIAETERGTPRLVVKRKENGP